MKVLQINTVCGTGSTGRIATDIYKTLEAKNDQCLIAYGRGDAPAGYHGIKISTPTDNHIHGLYTRITDKHGFASGRSTTKLIQAATAYNADIIHLHNLHGYYLNIEMLFLYLATIKKPVVWTLHDCWSFTGHCAHFDYIHCEKWKTQCNHCPEKRRYPASRLFDHSQQNYRNKKRLFTSLENVTIVTPSKWLEALVLQSYLSKYPVKIINNGIDLQNFRSVPSNCREKYELQDKFVILGVASTWQERKGFSYFVELSKVLSQDYKIVLVGLTSKQKENLPKNMLGITRTNNVGELAQLYSMADIFVNPTREEVLGLTNLEALACGTPVITFNTGGSPETIDKSCGIVVEKDDFNGLLKAIKKLRTENLSAQSCVKRASLFNKNVKFQEYIALYESLIK